MLQNRGGVRKYMVTSGVVTANVKVADCMEERRAALNNKKNGMFSYGDSIAAGNDSYGRVHILPFDLLLTWKDIPQSVRDRQRYNGVRLGQFRPPVFSSFSGMIVDRSNSGQNDEIARQQLEDTLVAFGWNADTPYTFGELSQDDSGLTAIVHGSFTTRNTGIKAIAPGKLVQWRAPPIGDSYANFMQKRERLPGYSQAQASNARLLAVLEEYDAGKSCESVVTDLALGILRKANAGGVQLDADTIRAAGAQALSGKSPLGFTIEEAMLLRAFDYGDIVAFAGPAAQSISGVPAADRDARDAALRKVNALGFILHNASQKVVGRSLNYSIPGGELHLVH